MSAQSPAAPPYLTQVSSAGALEWRRTVSWLLVDIEPPDDAVGAFEGYLSCRTVRGIRFADVRASPSQSRSPSRPADARPALILCYQISGTGKIRQGTREAELRPGDLALYTTGRPSEVEFGADFHALSMRVPWGSIDLPELRLDPLLGTVLPRENGLGRVMGAYLEEVAPVLDTSSAADRLQATRAGVALLDTLVRSLRAESEVDAMRNGPALTVQMYAHIEANLGDPELTPTTLAAAMHISVRHVHNLFPPGETVAAYIRRRRLAMCERDLADPALERESVAVIARRWGFESASHFGQLFRVHVGLSPAAFRRSVLGEDRAA